MSNLLENLRGIGPSPKVIVLEYFYYDDSFLLVTFSTLSLQSISNSSQDFPSKNCNVNEFGWILCKFLNYYCQDEVSLFTCYKNVQTTNHNVVNE